MTNLYEHFATTENAYPKETGLPAAGGKTLKNIKRLVKQNIYYVHILTAKIIKISKDLTSKH